MIGVFVTVAVVCGYFAGWLTSAVVAAKTLARRAGAPHCHQEPRFGAAYKWLDRPTCGRYDEPGCWRSDGPMGLSLRTVGISTVAAVVWPVLLMPALVYVLASHSLGPTVDLRRIAEMEHELGIGDAR